MFLDERKQKILGAVVRDYVETIRPVGSEELATRHAWGVKSATIRNELAELSELGYLRQPHTSAGRIPSDLGYRFYVDHLMVARDIDEAKVSRSFNDNRTLEMERLLRQTCAMLTRMTSYTAVATPPRPADTLITQVFITTIGDNHLLLAVVLSTGQVENRLFAEMSEISASDLVMLGNALNAAFSGKSLDSISVSTKMVAPEEFNSRQRKRYDAFAHTVLLMIQHNTEEETVYLEGATEILRQPEFRDVTKLESLFETLQRRTLLFQTLSRALFGSDVTIVIGEENYIPAMQECSVVTASYYIGTQERGTIGVVGPTRMDYDRAVPAVNFFARSLSQTLTRLSCC
jgi:heat-inducible transcriptional repressor